MPVPPYTPSSLFTKSGIVKIVWIYPVRLRDLLWLMVLEILGRKIATRL